MKLRLALALVFLCACSGQVASQTPATTAPPAMAPDRIYDVQVIRSFPHDQTAFTEGLSYAGNGQILESTGMEGESDIRKVDLETGKVLQKRSLPKPYFGEGIVAWKDRLIELTWQHKKGFIYDLATFEPKGEFAYEGEGWALTTDGSRIIMTDGTEFIRFLDPETLKETGRIAVTFLGKPLKNINEVEWIKGELWANIWQTEVIVRIDPKTGQVLGRVLLNGLLRPADRGDSKPDVLNGIAYDAGGDRIFVTGKYWPKLYEIRVVERPRAPAPAPP